MSDEKYDLNIDNYSEEELCKLIKYKGDIQDLTPEYLQDHIGQIINKSKKKYNNNPQTIDHLTRFLTSVNDKLLSYVTVRPHVQYEPTNYNIIQSLFSNLTSLSLLDLWEMRKNYKKLSYSLTDIDLQLMKLISYPLYLITLLAIPPTITILSNLEIKFFIILILVEIFDPPIIHVIGL